MPLGSFQALHTIDTVVIMTGHNSKEYVAVFQKQNMLLLYAMSKDSREFFGGTSSLKFNFRPTQWHSEEPVG